MKYWLLLTLLVLAACSRTETVYFPLEEQGQQQIIEQEPESTIVVPDTTQIEPQDAAQNTQSTSTDDEELDERSSQSTINAVQSAETDEQALFNPSNEYEITSCCEEGRLFAQAKKERNLYSENDVVNLLIKIYQDNCEDIGNNLIQRVYLRFKGDIQDSSYLTYFKSINYKRLQVDYRTVNNDFETCS